MKKVLKQLKSIKKLEKRHKKGVNRTGGGFSCILFMIGSHETFSHMIPMVNHGLQKWRDATKFHNPHRAMAFPDLVPSISEVSQSDGTAVELPTYSTACLPDRWRNHRRRHCETRLWTTIESTDSAFTSTVVIWDSCRGWYDCYSAFALQTTLLRKTSSKIPSIGVVDCDVTSCVVVWDLCSHWYTSYREFASPTTLLRNALSYTPINHKTFPGTKTNTASTR